MSSPALGAALRVSHLRKAYKDVVAVDDLELEVRAGECFGLLGPNGAGKTTTRELSEGRAPPAPRPTRRTEGGAGAGLRAGRRSRFAVSRRAPHGSRPASPAPALGIDRTVQVRGQDYSADHPLYGGSREALRTRGHRGSRQDHRHGYAPRVDRVDRRGTPGRVFDRRFGAAFRCAASEPPRGCARSPGG